MCRKNFVLTAGLIGFGVGLLLSCFIDSGLFRFLLGTAALVVGIALTGCK